MRRELCRLKAMYAKNDADTFTETETYYIYESLQFKTDQN